MKTNGLQGLFVLHLFVLGWEDDMVRCMVCSKIKRKDKLLVPKFGCLIKHLCLKKCYVDLKWLLVDIM
jgi:hypothetical protein